MDGCPTVRGRAVLVVILEGPRVLRTGELFRMDWGAVRLLRIAS